MSLLYDRNVSLTVLKPVGFFGDGSNQIQVTDLRVAFSIEKHLGKEPNTCSVKVYNMSADDRGAFESKPLKVRLYAGYDGDWKRLFVGDLRWGTSRRPDGTTWETELDVRDGDRATRHATVNRSYKAGIRARAALKEVAKAMGLELPRNVSDLSELDTQFVSGLSLYGQASEELTRLLAKHAMTWSIQDGRLQILRERDVHDSAPIVVSTDTGMIGSPEFSAPEKPKKKPRLHAKMLLHPDIRPGGRVSVASKTVNGVFKVERVTHEGDTDGPQWETSIEAVAV